jgi:putative MFS transporter
LSYLGASIGDLVSGVLS